MTEKNHTCSECEPQMEMLDMFIKYILFLKEKKKDRSRDTSRVSLTLGRLKVW